MPLTTKAVKIRLRSINNTKKITRAMEMVSASKMRKTTKAVLSSRPYATNAWQLLMRLVKVVANKNHPLISQRTDVKSIAIVLVTANRGLCGGFNQQVINTALKQADYLKNKYSSANIEWISLGKKGSDYLARNKYNLAYDYEKADVINDISSITSIAKSLMENYLEGKYDLISLVYTDFKSSLIQKPKFKTILPLSMEYDDDLGSVTGQEEDKDSLIGDVGEYLFEPSADKLLNDLLPKFLEVQIYQALLESNASEHSARMMAMKNASSSASDMINDLTLTFNQLRQASITREIAEISGGRAALGL